MRYLAFLLVLACAACSTDSVNHGATLTQACMHVCECLIGPRDAGAVPECSSSCSGWVSSRGWPTSSLSFASNSLGTGIEPSAACLECIQRAPCPELDMAHPCANVCPR